MRFGLITLFPEMFTAITEYGVTGRAAQKGILAFDYWNPRDFTKDKHRTVDDKPYGGGPGMLMKVQPLADAIHAAKASMGSQTKVIYLSPQGKQLKQGDVNTLAQTEKLILVAGRYEGIDERLINNHIDTEYSVGDYVLSGGELPAMVMIDAIARQIPGVLGDSESANQDSFSEGLLECPQFTRPEILEGNRVPPILLSGDHAAIQRWRLQQQLGRTWQRRPDLLEKLNLSSEQARLLNEFKAQHTGDLGKRHEQQKVDDSAD